MSKKNWGGMWDGNQTYLFLGTQNHGNGPKMVKLKIGFRDF
jgi:hypothetical protein